MHIASRVFLNTATNWMATGTKAAVNLLLVPFLISKLSPEGYGLASLTLVTMSFAILADFGIRSALTRHLTEEYTKGNQERFNKLCSSAFAFSGSVGLVLATCAILFAHPMAKAINVSPDLMNEGMLLIRWCIAPGILLQLIIPIFDSVTFSQNRYDLINIRDSIIGICQGVGMFIALSSTSHGFKAWACIIVAGYCLRLLLTRQVARTLVPWLRIRPALISKEVTLDLFAFSGILFLIQVASTVGTQANPYILSSCLGVGAVAIYAPAISLAAAVRPLIAALSNQLQPLATDFHVSGAKERLHDLLIRGTKYSMLMCLPACVMLGCFGDRIAHVWLSKELGPDHLVTGRILMAWAIIELLFYAAGTQWAVAMAMRRMAFYAWVMIPSTVLSVSASILLVKYTQLGVAGVIIPTIAVKLVQRPIWLIYVSRSSGMTARHYLKTAYLQPFVVLALLVCAALACRITLQPPTLTGLVICALLVCLVWVFLCWFVGFNVSDRESIRNLLRRIASRLSNRRSSGTRRAAQPGDTNRENRNTSEGRDADVLNREPGGDMPSGGYT